MPRVLASSEKPWMTPRRTQDRRAADYSEVKESIMKRLSTLLTATLIALIVLTAAPSAMAGRDNNGSNAEQVIKCAVAAANPAKRWYGKFGKCIAFHRADGSAGKTQPTTPE